MAFRKLISCTPVLLAKKKSRNTLKIKVLVHHTLFIKGIKIRQMNFIGNPEKLNIQGLPELFKKNLDSFTSLKSPFKDLSYITSFFKDDESIFLTGIGSSESHARYLEVLLKNYTKFNVKFLNIMEFYTKSFNS
jgi:hypothetical protein